jgi:MerR family transcriptional regulator, copper efflux regulator
MEGFAMSRTGTKEAALTIGRLSKQSGVAAKTIRYYEETGLLPEPKRAANGYRYYEQRSVHVLRFVGRARELGFPIDDIQELLTLWNNKRRKSSSVRAIAEAHLAAVQDKIGMLQGMQNTLQHLIHCCHGDDRPDCPILDELSAQD